MLHDSPPARQSRRNHLPLRGVVSLILAGVAALVTPGVAPAQDVLTIDAVQTAGMSGFRAHWDAPFVLAGDGSQTITDSVIKDRGGQAVWQDGAGALAFDALNRSLLIRFPTAAEAIAAELAKGHSIAKVEIVLPFRDEELWPIGNSDYIGPDGYQVRKNWDVDKLYRQDRPEWHAVAVALRRPWQADATTGPTFNANVNGASYWTRYGAGDEATDRFAHQFGPAEVSYKQPEGRLDVTAALTDPAFGPTLAARLRGFADCGVLVNKWETYDHRYFTGCYEWGTACGGRAILIATPKLVVTFAAGASELGAALPPPADLASLKGGAPTAVMPTADQLTAIAAEHATKPAWMPDWQWARVRELYAAQNPAKANEPFWFQFVPDFQINRLRESYRDPAKSGIQYRPPSPQRVYEAWVDTLIGRQPRGWSGFESAREMSQWYLYHDTLPGPAQDAIKRYWTAWLMPDRETAPLDKQRDHTYTAGPLVHPMVDDARVDATVTEWLNPLKGVYDTYWKTTGDWRGNKSFFRSGFTYWISTQNFNTTASAGALLAGAMIGSDRAMADGRNGVETWLMRQWAWADGSGQEHIDHYYFAVTVAGNKAIADFGQTPYDRLLGQSLLTKNVEELTGAYHPGLRTFIAGSSRTGLDLVLGTQDGLQHVLHTLSPAGTLRDYGTLKLPQGLDTYGHDVPPAQVAQQTVAGPWAPAWVVPMVDAKPLPFEAKHTGWGGVKRTAYLGANYGLATNAVNPGRIQVMAQWRRKAETAASMTDLGTLDLRLGVGQTRFANDGQGIVPQFGTISVVQQHGTMVALTSPFAQINDKAKGAAEAKSLQSSIGLFNFESPAPTWEIYIDGARVESLPITCKQGQRITVKDGVTWLGILPLAATDLGRDAEVVLEVGDAQKPDYYPSNYGAALVVNSYFYRGDKLVSEVMKASPEAFANACGGFVVELADTGDFADFAAFQAHFAAAKVEQDYDAATRLQTVKYANGVDTIEAASHTTIDDGKDVANLATWLVNGKYPHLPKGIERDTPYCQQGLGHVEKNGATLTADQGRRIFLLTEPVGGVYCGWNPLPDLTAYSFTAPGGLTVTADGKVGITRVVIRPGANSVAIDSAFKPGQETENGTASALLVSATADGKAPDIVFNGLALATPATRVVDGKTFYVVPLK